MAAGWELAAAAAGSWECVLLREADEDEDPVREESLATFLLLPAAPLELEECLCEEEEEREAPLEEEEEEWWW